MTDAKLYRPIQFISDRNNDRKCYGDYCQHALAIAYSPEMSSFQNLEELAYWLKTVPLDRDNGGYHHCRCKDGDQRLIHWNNYLNCWEKTAHFIAGLIRFDVPIGVRRVFIIDWTVPQDPKRGRHIFPVLLYHDRIMRVIDLDEYDFTQRQNIVRYIDSSYFLSNGTDEWYNKLLGGLHIAGKTVLGAFGMSSVGDTLEKLEVDNGVLPDWAITNEKNRPKPPAPEKKTNKKGSGGKLTAKEVTDITALDEAIARFDASIASQREQKAALMAQRDEAMKSSKLGTASK